MASSGTVALLLWLFASFANISIQEQDNVEGDAASYEGGFCASTACMNNGTCIESQRACRCPPMYFGKLCETHQSFVQPQGACHNHPCLNDGQCEPTTGQCLCPQGFTGRHCEQRDWTQHISKWRGKSSSKVLSYWALAVSSTAFAMVLGLSMVFIHMYKKMQQSAHRAASAPPTQPVVVPHYIVIPPESQMSQMPMGAHAAKPPVYDNSPAPPIYEGEARL